jgi:alpha(1,3/1,4) fucosyltransferase
MRTVGLAFANMWGRSSAFQADYLLECFPCLCGHYHFELTQSPELAFFSVYGYIRDRYDGAIRLVYAGEPGDHLAQGGKISPGACEQGFYDFGITCAAEQSSPNHCYMPQGLLHLNLYNRGVSTLLRQPGEAASRKEFFCNFVYSNGNSRDRIEFFHKLSLYKRIESCGHVERNNDALARGAYSREGYRLKQAFQARCKFSIAMENSYFPGYNTEKITDPLVARSIPIYKGDPRIAETFNPLAFINVSDFKSDEEAIEFIKAVDQDDALYKAYLDAPPFVGNVIPARFTDEHYLKFWQRVLQ